MSRKTLRFDDFGTSLIPRDANDTAVLSLDLMEEEFIAVRCSANGSCLYNGISLLIKGKCVKVCCSCSCCCWRIHSLAQQVSSIHQK